MLLGWRAPGINQCEWLHLALGTTSWLYDRSSDLQHYGHFVLFGATPPSSAPLANYISPPHIYQEGMWMLWVPSTYCTPAMEEEEHASDCLRELPLTNPTVSTQRWKGLPTEASPGGCESL